LISILRAGNELDRLEASLRTAADVYDHAIVSTAEYAIELYPGDVQEFRDHLDAIRCRLPRGAGIDEWHEAKAGFRGELRNYRDKAMDRVARFRAELRAAVEAMEAFALNVADSGNGHEREIAKALAEIDHAMHCESVREILDILGTVRVAVAASVEQMTKSHRMVIAQLRDEVRVLHQQINKEQQAATQDHSTGVWNRHKLDSHIGLLTEESGAFCLLLLHVRNMRRLQERFPVAVLNEALRTSLQRFASLSGHDVLTGRWSEDTFAAILQMERSAAMQLSREASVQLSGSYLIQQDGIVKHVTLEITTGVIEHRGETNLAAFQKKLMQMSDAIAKT